MANPPDWRYPQRRRFAGPEVGCLLCPTMIQPTVPGGTYGDEGSIEGGLRAHLRWVHGIDDDTERERIVADALRNRPRRHHAETDRN